MISLLSAFAATLSYEINPLNSNVWFNIGQPLMVILLIFTAVAGILTFVARASNLTKLDLVASRWLSYLATATFYFGLIWLGLSMLISFAGKSLLDTINGALVLILTFISLVKRFGSDQTGANRFLIGAYVFLGLVLIWTFASGAVLGALPEEVRAASGDIFQPNFFSDLFHLWRWI